MGVLFNFRRPFSHWGSPLHPIHFARAAGDFVSNMAVEITSAIWGGKPEIQNGTLLVLIRLADMASYPDGVCWPSIPTVASHTRLSERQVRRIIRELEECGILTVEQRGDKHMTSVYRVHVDQIRKGDMGVPLRGTFATGEGGHLRHEGGHGCPPNHKRSVTKDPTKAQKLVLPEIPEILRTPAFEAAWADWVNYRKEARKALKPMCAAEQLSFLATLGPDGAVTAIRNSIRNSWQGLFEPKSSLPARNGYQNQFVNPRTIAATSQTGYEGVTNV
jgi:hypothetical protein